MVIRGFSHKGIRCLFLRDDPGRVPAAAVGKLRKMLRSCRMKTHRLTGDRKGAWSLHVTRSWGLTFHACGDEITNVNLEDYH